MHIPSHLSVLRTKYFLKKNKKTSLNEDISLIKSLLRNTDKPFLIGRLGFTESLVIGNIITKYYDQSVEKEAEQESGVFPGGFLTTILCASEQLFALNNCDLLAVWPIPYLRKATKVSNFTGNFIDLEALNLLKCLSVSEIWSTLLLNKKVLIISPLKETIKQNYLKKEQIKHLNEILPDLKSLDVIKAPYGTFANSTDTANSSWVNNLHEMQKKMSKIDYDICLTGCGGYGFPLACYSKVFLEKPALHLGGALQLLFGIKGKRWTRKEHAFSIKKYMDSWESPLIVDQPEDPNSIERGAYF